MLFHFLIIKKTTKKTTIKEKITTEKATVWSTGVDNISSLGVDVNTLGVDVITLGVDVISAF